MIDVIIPICNYIQNSFEERVINLNFILNNFYAQQTKIKLYIIEQSLDGVEYFRKRLLLPSNIEVQYKVICHSIFNKQWCINTGFNLSDSKYIVVADADIYSSNKSLFYNLSYWVESLSLKWAFGWNELYYTTQQEKLSLLNRSSIEQQKERLVNPIPNYSEGGLVLFQRDFFKEIGMANEYMLGLGAVDNELVLRAKSASNTYKAFPQLVYHLWHEKMSEIERKNKFITKINRAILKLVIKDPFGAIQFLKS